MKKPFSLLVATFAVAAITFAGPPVGQVGAQILEPSPDTPPSPNFQCTGETASECPPPARCINLLPHSPLKFAQCVAGKLIRH